MDSVYCTQIKQIFIQSCNKTYVVSDIFGSKDEVTSEKMQHSANANCLQSIDLLLKHCNVSSGVFCKEEV